MTQFKEKSAKKRELVSAGLFFYPVLQAADVLAYKAHEVPVGEDQRQHIELMREIARRFNERFGEILVEPERCILFRQSDVREHTELTWYLSALTAHGDLNRMTQFKEKSAKQRELVSAGLFFYPVLQAADVLAYKAHEVPVGEDQRQHIELMREIARRFNERFGEILVEPEHRIPEVGARIMDLQEPSSKMTTTGGTEQGTVYVLDDPRAVTKKIKSAVTDSGTEVKRGEGKEGIANLIEILAVARGTTEDEIEKQFDGSGYGDFKGAVAEAVVEFLAPVRERYEKLRPDEAALEATLTAGAEKARAIASETLAEVREAIGVGSAQPS
jgi:tryptophanyl-tRNA synthetase